MDTRYTARRRVRHCDGTLLHGRIGFTTWLGWRDEEVEDEDAPSLLTRRLSAAKPNRHARCRGVSTASTVSASTSAIALRKSASVRNMERLSQRSPDDDWSLALTALVPLRAPHPRAGPRVGVGGGVALAFAGSGVSLLAATSLLSANSSVFSLASGSTEGGYVRACTRSPNELPRMASTLALRPSASSAKL
jgi:hypothetical protein